MFPDFIGIGAQKAGTTWLSHNLQYHPQIWMPPLKEIHYFDERLDEPLNPVLRLSGRLSGGRGVDRRWRRQVKSRIGRHLKQFSRERFLWDLRYYLGAPGDDWYASLFEPGEGRVVGEITPAYSMLEPATVAHIYEVVPQAKIVFMMRNPIERAWSQIVMRFNRDSERDITSVKDKRLQRNFEREGSRTRTDYLRTLETWGYFYPEEQIFVGFLEDVHLFPGALLNRVYEFLGVDSTFEPPGVEQRVHSRSTGQIPARFAVYLAHTYLDDLRALHERFGGYASFWLYCAEKLVNDPPEEEHIPYPLWESVLWREWTDGPEAIPRSPQFQSGPLPSVR